MTFYDEMQQVASGVLQEFTQGIISYIRPKPTTGPVDDPVSGGEPDVFQLAGAVANGVSKKYVDMGLAVATDLQVIANVDPRFTPDMNGSMMIDGVKMKLLGIFQKPNKFF